MANWNWTGHLDLATRNGYLEMATRNGHPNWPLNVQAFPKLATQTIWQMDSPLDSLNLSIISENLDPKMNLNDLNTYYNQIL